MFDKERQSEQCFICEGPLAPLQVETTTHIRDWSLKSGYGVCQGCNFAQATNIPCKELLEEYYATNSQLRREFWTAQEVFHIEKQISFLLRYEVASKNILEYGPDMGHFLQLLRNRRPSSSFYFSEYNEQAFSYLLRLGFEKYGGEPVDLIVARHVFEHILNPVDWLSSLSLALVNEGLIFIEVPDYTVISSVDCDPFQFEHLSYFTLGSIQKIAEKSGFVIQAIERDRTPGYSVSSGYVIRAILRKLSSEEAIGTWELLSNNQRNTFEKFSRQIQIAKSGGKVVAIYGAGTLSKQLSTDTDLETVVSLVYDVDPKKIGLNCFGVEIRDANLLSASEFDVIFVTVLGYKDEVGDFLRSRRVSDSKIQYLY